MVCGSGGYQIDGGGGFVKWLPSRSPKCSPSNYKSAKARPWQVTSSSNASKKARWARAGRACWARPVRSQKRRTKWRKFYCQAAEQSGRVGPGAPGNLKQHYLNSPPLSQALWVPRLFVSRRWPGARDGPPRQVYKNKSTTSRACSEGRFTLNAFDFQ